MFNINFYTQVTTKLPVIKITILIAFHLHGCFLLDFSTLQQLKQFSFCVVLKGVIGSEVSSSSLLLPLKYRKLLSVSTPARALLNSLTFFRALLSIKMYKKTTIKIGIVPKN